MNPKQIALGAAAAVVIAAAGFFLGGRMAGPAAPDPAATEAAVASVLAANPALLKAPEPASAPAPAPAAAAPAASPVPAASPAPLAAQLSDDQVTEVEGIIRNYLLTNPEIIREAINELQRREDEAEKVAQVAAISENTGLIFDSPRQVVLGNPEGDVTLVEFFDYNCGYCKRAHADMNKLLDEDKQLKIVLKEFPVLGPGSMEAAQVSIAVKMLAPEKAGEFFHAMMEVQGQVNRDRALAVAEDLGVDPAKIRAMLDDKEVQETIGEVYDLASKLSLTGTPSYVTAGEVVVGAVGYEALKEKVATARAACASANC